MSSSYSRVLPDADRALSAAEQEVIDRSSRTVTDPRLRRAVFRLSGAGTGPFDAPLMGAPEPGVVLSLGHRDRILLLSTEVEFWDQDDVDAETFAPDGQPEAGEFVYVTGVTVAATASEANYDAAADERAAKHRRRAALERRIRALITGPAPDREYPAADDPALAGRAQLRRVPRSEWEGRSDGAIYVDPADQTVYLYEHNGLDGDDWSISNVPSWRVWRMPLTAERAELIADLRTEYELDSWLERGYSAQTAVVFIGSGWSALQMPLDLSGFRVDTPEDARVVLSRTPEQWYALGWITVQHLPPRRRFTPAEAIELGEAGITRAAATARSISGHSTVEDIIAARAPRIPTDATRIHLLSKRSFAGFGMRAISDDAAAAQQYLDRRPEDWDCQILTDDAHILHATDKWALCQTRSDELELIAARWIGAGSRPDANLSPVAEAALSKLAATGDESLLADTTFWRPVLTATHHQASVVDTYEDNSTSWKVFHAIKHHQYILADGTTLDWWELVISEGGMVNGEGDSEESTQLFASKANARDVFRRAHSPHVPGDV